MFQKLRKQEGQSLIEVIAALAVVIIVLLALVITATLSVRNTTFAKNQALATEYAQELIEEARERRNEDKESFFIDGSCDTNATIPPFTLERECNLDPGDDERVEVVAKVTWEDSRGEHQSELVTHLTRW